MKNKAALIILDGWGHGSDPKRSAISQANTPFIDSLYHILPNTELITFGEEVGLPAGQMGNSEVGHLNIGAGRIVYQDFARINKAIKDNELAKNPVLAEAIARAKELDRPIHLLGLVSDGGVHSHINHVIALSSIINASGVKVHIHAFLDGRDTDPEGGALYLQKLQDHIDLNLSKIVTCVGRYYAMDRDNRWERIARAYHLIVFGECSEKGDIISAVKASYTNGITDEFMPPILSEKANVGDLIRPLDVVLFFNFRTDRPRQLTTALTQKDYVNEGMTALPLSFYTMTNYNKEFQNVKVLFEKDDLIETLGEVLEKNDKTQFRIAETEKYPHVTFFFSGGREIPYRGESRIVVKSPNVATYDLQPEMSAYEVTDELISKIKKDNPDFICVNYANTDMVGHTGDFNAAMTAAETVDHCIKKVVEVLTENDYAFIIIADHGNADIMIKEDGSPHTAHTTNMVPLFIGGLDLPADTQLEIGKLGDIAPTILDIMGLEQPKSMTGRSLLR